MTYRERLPHPALRPFVDRFWWRVPGSAPAAGDSRVTPAGPYPILPDGCIDILIDLTRGSSSVVGTMTRAKLVREAPSVCLAAVRFRPGAAVPFLGVAAPELTDLVLELRELEAPWLGPCSREFPDHTAALDAIEQSLLARLGAMSPADAMAPSSATRRRVNHAVCTLLRYPATSIHELARQIGWTRQHLTRVFRQHVGIGPKELGRVSRLHQAVHRLQHDARTELAEAALDLGYFDQAHMAREFRTLAGITPKSARDRPGSICPIPSLWLEA